jgi:hypothetical protein
VLHLLRPVTLITVASAVEYVQREREREGERDRERDRERETERESERERARERQTDKQTDRQTDTHTHQLKLGEAVLVDIAQRLCQVHVPLLLAHLGACMCVCVCVYARVSSFIKRCGGPCVCVWVLSARGYACVCLFKQTHTEVMCVYYEAKWEHS